VRGHGDLDSARRRRDLSLVLRRRLTVSAAVAATALTGVFMLVAAATAPGKAAPTSAQGGAQNPSPNQGAAIAQPGFNPPAQLPQSGFNPPAQLPQSGFGGSSPVISGGS